MAIFAASQKRIDMSYTIVIIAITVLFSIAGLNNSKIQNQLLFNAYAVHHGKQWHRLFSYGLVHGDWVHLAVNMFVLYSFGQVVEYHFGVFYNFPNLLFEVFYVSAIIVSTLTSLTKHKDDPYYNAVGASGAVSAMVFASILFAPTQKVYIYGLLGLPGYLFGPVYLYYSWYMAKKGMDNIGHDAHFVGAIYGLTFPILMDHKIISHFIGQIFGN